MTTVPPRAVGDLRHWRSRSKDGSVPRPKDGKSKQQCGNRRHNPKPWYRTLDWRVEARMRVLRSQQILRDDATIARSM